MKKVLAFSLLFLLLSSAIPTVVSAETDTIPSIQIRAVERLITARNNTIRTGGEEYFKLERRIQKASDAFVGIGIRFLVATSDRNEEWFGSKNIAIITEVFGKSPAEKAGLKQGEVVIAINGRPLPEKERDGDVRATILGDKKLGRSVSLTVWSNSETRTVTLALAELRPARPEEGKKVFDNLSQSWDELVADMDAFLKDAALRILVPKTPSDNYEEYFWGFTKDMKNDLSDLLDSWYESQNKTVTNFETGAK